MATPLVAAVKEHARDRWVEVELSDRYASAETVDSHIREAAESGLDLSADLVAAVTRNLRRRSGRYIGVHSKDRTRAGILVLDGTKAVTILRLTPTQARLLGLQELAKGDAHE